MDLDNLGVFEAREDLEFLLDLQILILRGAVIGKEALQREFSLVAVVLDQKYASLGSVPQRAENFISGIEMHQGKLRC
jgi:hypothetical protein